MQNIQNFSFITLVNFWYEILRRIDRVQLRLQDLKINFREAFHDLELAEIREKNYIAAIEKAKSICKRWDINTTERVRRRRKMPGK